MGGLTPLSAAAYAEVRRVLADAYPMPLSTTEVENQSGYGIRYGQLGYRMLRRMVARGEAEQITVPDMRCRYWRLEPACAAAAPDTIAVPPCRPRRPAACATKTVRITIYGERQIATFEAMCALAGRAPHELAYDWVLDRVCSGQADHQTQYLVRLAAAATLIFGGPRSAAGRREMTGLLRDLPEVDVSWESADDD